MMKKNLLELKMMDGSILDKMRAFFYKAKKGGKFYVRSC